LLFQPASSDRCDERTVVGKRGRVSDIMRTERFKERRKIKPSPRG